MLRLRCAWRPSSRLLAGTLVLALSGTVGLPLHAEPTPEEKGLQIALEMEERDTGFEDSEAALEMVLTDRQGESSRRALRITTLEEPARQEGDKSLVIFDHPRDIAGTALLSYTHIAEPDDQWLYLPALKRVKRISAANKSGPFVGSEFAYEDLLAHEVDKYTYRWLRDEACPAPGGAGLTCFVVERYPVYANSGYTRQVMWVDQTEYRPLQIEYYDRKGALLKTLVLQDYQQYLGHYWRAHTLVMQNQQTGKGTTLHFAPYDFRQGIGAADFNPKRLNRQR